MKKALLTKLMLLLCALIAGSSSVWAGENDPIEVTISYSDIPDGFTATTGTSGNFTKTVKTADDLTINYSGINTKSKADAADHAYGYAMFLKNYGYIYSSTVPSGYYPSKVTVTFTSGTGETGKAGISYGTAAITTRDANVTGAVAKNGTCELTNSDQTKLYWNFSTTGANVQVNNIKVVYSKITAANVTSAPTISGNTPFLSTTTVTITNSASADGATIYYTTDGSDPTTSSSTYSAPFNVNATTTVKAIAKLSDKDASSVVSQTFTKVTPMTVAAAITAINALEDGGTIADQCVAGVISQIDSYNSSYKSITYWISDDGTTSSQLEVYSGKGLNGADFSAISDLNVGDQVTVYGTLKKFGTSPNTTPEFNQNSQLLSYSATGTAAPIITASNVTIDSEATSGEITYTIDNPTAASLTAAVKSGDWISNVQVDAGNKKVTFSVTQNDGEQRIGYITLSYEGATSKDVKVTQKASYGIAKLPFAFDGGKADVETTLGLTHTGLGSDYSYSPKLKFDGAGDELILKINDNPSVLTFDIKGNSFSEGTFTVQTSANGVTYTDLKSYTELGTVSHETLDLASTVRYIKWIYTSKSGGNVALGRIGVDCDAVTIPAAGYTTYCNATTKAVSFARVTAYKVSNVGATSVTLEEITEAPANTPVILNGAAGTYALDIIASASAVGTNKLNVSDGNATTDDANTVYALAAKGEPAVVGFYKVKAGVKVPAGKCYLSVAVTSAPEYLGFGGDGNTTSVNDVRSKMEEGRGEFYNLAGQRVAQPTKGLYIVNGKKVVIK